MVETNHEIYVPEFYEICGMLSNVDKKYRFIDYRHRQLAFLAEHPPFYYQQAGYAPICQAQLTVSSAVGNPAVTYY